MSNPFVDCPDYRGEPDDKYEACLQNVSGDPCILIADLHRAKDFRHVFFVLLPFVLIAFFTNGGFIWLAVQYCIRHRRSRANKKKRKLFAFTVNRCANSLLALILICIVLIAWKTESFKYSTATMFLLVGGLTILINTGTYLAVTWIFYRAIVAPFASDDHGMTRTLFVIVCIWLLSVGFSIFLGMFGATLFYPETAPITCDFDTCQMPLAITIIVVLTLSFFTVSIFYTIMFLRIRMRTRVGAIGGGNAPSAKDKIIQQNIKALNRLSLNLANFTLSKLPLILIALISVANLRRLAFLGYGKKSSCKTFSDANLFLQVEILAFIAGLCWLIGMCIDPVISLVTDADLMSDLRRGRLCCRRGGLSRFETMQSNGPRSSTIHSMHFTDLNQ